MQTNDNQYFIYVRSTNQRIACTKQQFEDYYRDINAYRRTQMNHGRCVCPKSKWLTCDMDCYTCPYRTNGDISYLDDNLKDNEGNEMNWLDYLQLRMPDLQEPAVDEYITDKVAFTKVLSRICEIMPQAIEIGRFRQQGLTDEAIAEKIGTGRKPFAYRLKKAEKTLKDEFPDIL